MHFSSLLTRGVAERFLQGTKAPTIRPRSDWPCYQIRLALLKLQAKCVAVTRTRFYRSHGPRNCMYNRICLACCLAEVALPSTVLQWLRPELKMHRAPTQPSDSSAPALIQTSVPEVFGHGEVSPDSKTDAVIVCHSRDVCFLVWAGSLQASIPSSHFPLTHDKENRIKLHTKCRTLDPTEPRSTQHMLTGFTGFQWSHWTPSGQAGPHTRSSAASTKQLGISRLHALERGMGVRAVVHAEDRCHNHLMSSLWSMHAADRNAKMATHDAPANHFSPLTHPAICSTRPLSLAFCVRIGPFRVPAIAAWSPCTLSNETRKTSNTQTYASSRGRHPNAHQLSAP